jgi:hypothetical protein
MPYVLLFFFFAHDPSSPYGAGIMLDHVNNVRFENRRACEATMQFIRYTRTDRPVIVTGWNVSMDCRPAS